MPSFFRPVFGSKPVQIRSTPKAVTPFGGLVSLFEFFNKIGLAPKLAETMPFTLHSPNAIPPAHTLMAFVISVVAGAKRFAHTDWLRFDRALHAMLGIGRFPGADTVRNLFARFNQRAIETFWRPLWRWLLPLFEMPTAGFSLDLDSTVFQRSGHQQGAAKGYNPKRPGRKTHHPLLAVLGPVRAPRVAAQRQHVGQPRRLALSFRGAGACAGALEDPLRAGRLGFLFPGTL